MIKPTNKIVLDSQNMHIQTMKLYGVSYLYPGRLVKKGTNDDDAIINTSGGAAIGWIGYEQTTKKYRAATVDTAQASGDHVAILSGPGMVLVASAISGASISKGARLATRNYGRLSGGTLAAGDVVAIAEESLSNASGGDILVRSLI
jgi:hypothetical protein